MTPTKKNLLAVLAVAVVGGVSSAVYHYYAGEVLQVETARVVRRDLHQVVTAAGEIKARNSIDIFAESSGRVAEIYIEEGDQVASGRRLAKIETLPSAAKGKALESSLQRFAAELAARSAAIDANEASRQTQQASLQRANAELQRARGEFERAGQLLKEQLIARKEYEQRRTDFATAVAKVEEAQARVQELAAQQEELVAERESRKQKIEKAKAQLQRASNVSKTHYVISPLDGIVTNVRARVGEMVVPASAMMTIADMSSITAEVKLDATDIIDIAPGQKAQIVIEGFPNRVFHGQVTEINDAAKPRSAGTMASQVKIARRETKEFKVIVALDEPPADIRPGISCMARVTTATRRDVLTLPAQVLTVRPAKDLTELLDPDTARVATEPNDPNREVEGVFVVRGTRVKFRSVKTGIRGRADIEVLGGLQEDDEIVTGSNRVLRTIRPGARVRLKRDLGE